MRFSLRSPARRGLLLLRSQSTLKCLNRDYHERLAARNEASLSAELNAAVYGRAGPPALNAFIILIMPFTLSHAAAALPFRRTRLIMSALVFGCFAPDFEYFLWLRPHGHFGHTLPGLFIFDVPAALVSLILFHRYVREPLTACLPARLRERLLSGPRFSIESGSTFALVCLSILVGSATHIVWDSFTHTEYWVGQHWEFLSTNVDVPLFGPRSWAAVFQYISSAGGLLIILLWFVHWYRETPPVHSQKDGRISHRDRIVVACTFLVAAVAGLARAAVPGLPDGVHGWQRFMTDAFITGMTVFCFEVLFYGFVRNRMIGVTRDA
jgi:hypothetical protein